MCLITLCVFVFFWAMIFYHESDKREPDSQMSSASLAIDNHQKPDNKSGNHHVPDAKSAKPESKMPLARSDELDNNLNHCNPLDLIPPCIPVVMIKDLTSSMPTQTHLFIQDQVPAQEYVFLANLPPWIPGEEIVNHFEIMVGEVERSYMFFYENGVYSCSMAVIFKYQPDARKAYKIYHGMVFEGYQTDVFYYNQIDGQKQEDINVVSITSESIFELCDTNDNETTVLGKANEATTPPTANSNQSKYLPTLQTIPEDTEGENNVAEMELILKQLKLQVEKNSQLQSQIAFLLAEKNPNGEQHPRDQGSETIGCGTDEQVVVASTQTEWTSEFDGEILLDAESYGFELDFEMIERFSGQNQPFYIPALDDQPKPKPSVVAPRMPKVDYLCSDIRYRNQPISRYVVNSDGTTLTYDDVVEPMKSPQEISSARKTEPRAVPDDVKETCVIDYQKVEDLIIISSSIEQETLGYDKLLLKCLPIEEYGRLVGKGGANIQRIEKESNVRVSTNKPIGNFFSLIISGNSEEMLQTAANDIIGGLQVKTACHLKYVHRISVHKLKEIGQNFFVKIQRSSEEDGKIFISGRLANCKLAYATLVSELRTFH